DVDPNVPFIDPGGHVITLFPDDRWPDVFMRDRTLGTTTLLSTASDGSGADGFWPEITPDGRFVVFGAGDGALIPGANSWGDVYVYSAATGALEADGYDAWGNSAKINGPFSISADGNVVTFINGDPLAKLTPDTPTPTDPEPHAANPHIYAR